MGSGSIGPVFRFSGNRLALTEGRAGPAVAQRTAIFPLRDGEVILPPVKSVSQLFEPFFFEQTAERAFKGTRFPPRNAIANERRGLAATDMALSQVLRGEKGVVRDAMYRHGAGSITFYVGEAGNAAKKYRGGSGIAHIIAKHGPEVMPEVIETISKGTHTFVERGVGRKMVIKYGDHTAVLVLVEARAGKRGSWLLTGYEKGDTDINFDLSQLTGPLFFKSN